MSAQLSSKVVVAMSGGVDSSVAAALLVEAGYDVFGLTMRILPGNSEKNNSCAPDLSEAGRVAQYLGIPHEELDLSPDFERAIIGPFVAEYAGGRTPNPCVRCNRNIKFGMLLEHARARGARYMATGHYVRIEERHGRHALRRAVDPAKDQSYVLAGLTQDQLAHALFPLGNQRKTETRALARSLGLDNAEKPGSKEVCFAPAMDHKRLLKDRLGEPRPGPVVTTTGEVLGQHRGLVYYTVGQRRGLGIASERPLYVVGIDASRNAVIAGFEEETFCTSLCADQVNWCAIEPPVTPFACAAQIRYNQSAPYPATVYPEGDGITVRFHEPVRSVAPGQWAVLYDGDYVLGNGMITSFESAMALSSNAQ